TQRLLVGSSVNPLGEISASRYERWRRVAERDENRPSARFGTFWRVGRAQRAKDKAARMRRAARGAGRRKRAADRRRAEGLPAMRNARSPTWGGRLRRGQRTQSARARRREALACLAASRA